MIKGFAAALRQRRRTVFSAGATRSFALFEDAKDFKNVALHRLNMPGVTIVKNKVEAKHALSVLTKLRDRLHAWDTETIDLEVKEESPVGKGKVICATAFAGPDVDFGNGPRLYIDNFGVNSELIQLFRGYFEDESFLKVWHNYGFDRHVLFNHGINVRGFGGDTMHMARLVDPSRGPKQYSLANASRFYAGEIEAAKRGLVEHFEGLYSNGKNPQKAASLAIYREHFLNDNVKHSMKRVFGTPKILKDGREGKTISMPTVLQMATQEEHVVKWVSYSTRDAEITFFLREVLAGHLLQLPTDFEGMKNMMDLYLRYWRPFGEVLTDMERVGIRVDRDYLAKIQADAEKDKEQRHAAFMKWLNELQPGCSQFNVSSPAQLQQLFFAPFKRKKEAGSSSGEEKEEEGEGKEEEDVLDEEGDSVRKVVRKEENEFAAERAFRVENSNGDVLPGKKKALKHREMVIKGLGIAPIEFTDSGLPSVDTAVLKALAGTPSKGKFGAGMSAFPNDEASGKRFCEAVDNLVEFRAIDTLLQTFILPLQQLPDSEGRIHCSLNVNTETGRLSSRRPNLQNQPTGEKDKYKIRRAFQAAPGNKLIVADYGQLELRVLAIMTRCETMIKAFAAGGDFHSRTALSMYEEIRKEVDAGNVLLEWDERKNGPPPKPLLKDKYSNERKRAKVMNFSIAYGKSAHGFARDWNCSVEEAKKNLDAWYKERIEVKVWQDRVKKVAIEKGWTQTLMGRYRNLTRYFRSQNRAMINGGLRAAINTPIQGGAADIVIAAMVKVHQDKLLRELGYKLLLQIHDEVILEGPAESAAKALARVKELLEHPLDVEFPVALEADADFGDNWCDTK